MTWSGNLIFANLILTLTEIFANLIQTLTEIFANLIQTLNSVPKVTNPKHVGSRGAGPVGVWEAKPPTKKNCVLANGHYCTQIGQFFDEF